jgi:hypothetical protein
MELHSVPEAKPELIPAQALSERLNVTPALSSLYLN